MSEIKLLMIGNSFSWNAYTYIQKIADSSSAKMVVGDICYPGCSLKQHKEFFETAAKVYGYEHTRRKSYSECDIDTALESDDWTHISLQQVSGYAGDYSSYQPYLDYVYDYVHKKVPNAEIIIHQTWAYQSDSTHERFPAFNCDQKYMFERIKEAYYLAAKDIRAKHIVPTGEAFQLARATRIGDHLCEDGFHANMLGQYIAGGAFFEVVTGQSIIDTKFKPAEMKEDDLIILKDCIHTAVDMYGRCK